MIDLINISVQFTGEYLFKDVNFRINSSDRIALVGRNGSGKTTLLKIICGLQQPESGKILKQRDVSIGYLPQEIIFHSGKPLFTEVRSSLKLINELQTEEEKITSLLETEQDQAEHTALINRLGEVHHKQEEIGYYSINSEIERVLIGLGFNETEFTKMTNEFSGGWQMRIALAKLLLSNHNLLLMDEPTNHLDLDSLEWLIGYLKGYKGALLIISHDKHFVNAITDKTLEIFLNKFSFFNGNYDAFFKFKEERDAQLENKFIVQQKKLKETEKFIERFRYKATKAKQVQSRIKQLEKLELIELPDSEEELNFKFDAPPQSGNVPIDLINIKKAYGDNVIFNGLNLRIDRGDKIAFVGPNGAGKTTLAKIIAEKTDFKGEKIVGHNTIISYYAQEVADNLDPELDILQSIDVIAENKTIGQLRSILGSFLFSGDDVFKKISVLSGGEKSRVALAKILLIKANLIVLDEPTNHLDISSKNVLQRALIDFPGSLIIISHDVDFLQPIVNKVIEIRNKSYKIYSGGIEYYLEKRNEFLMAEASDKAADANITSANRKEQKRLEAELRQQRYLATKDLLKEIELIEKKIEQLEKKKADIEKDLSNPEIYSNPQLSREKNDGYSQTKDELESIFLHWTELTEQLEKIERTFI